MEVDDAAAAAWYAAAAAEEDDKAGDIDDLEAGEADEAEEPGAEEAEGEAAIEGAAETEVQAEVDPYDAEADPYVALSEDPYGANGDGAEAVSDPYADVEIVHASTDQEADQFAEEPPRKAQKTHAQASVGQAPTPQDDRPRVRAAAALAEAFSAPVGAPVLAEESKEEEAETAPDASMEEVVSTSMLDEVQDSSAVEPAAADLDGEAWGPDVLVVKQGQAHIELQHRSPPLNDASLLRFCDWLDTRLPTTIRNFPYIKRSGAYIDLSDNAIGPEGLGKLFTVLREHRVPVVVVKAYRNLLDDSIVDTMIEYLYTQPESYPMHGIHISHNNITSKGAHRLIRAAAQCGHYPRFTSRLPLWLRLECNDIDDPGKLVAECNSEKFNVCLMGDGLCSRPDCNHYSHVHVQLPYFFNQGRHKQRQPTGSLAQPVEPAAPKMQPPPKPAAASKPAAVPKPAAAPKPEAVPGSTARGATEPADAMQGDSGQITEDEMPDWMKQDLKARETTAGVPAPKKMLAPKAGPQPPKAAPQPALDSLWPEGGVADADAPSSLDASEPPRMQPPPSTQPAPAPNLVVGDGGTDPATLGTRGKARGAPPPEDVVDLIDAEDMAAGIGADEQVGGGWHGFGRSGGGRGRAGRGGGRGFGGGGGWQGFGRSGGDAFQNPYRSGCVPTSNKGGGLGGKGGSWGSGWGGSGKGGGDSGGTSWGGRPRQMWQGMSLDKKAKLDLKLEVDEQLGFAWRIPGEGHAPQVISVVPDTTVGKAVQVGHCLLRMNGLDAKMFNEKQITDMLKQRPLSLRFGDE